MDVFFSCCPIFLKRKEDPCCDREYCDLAGSTNHIVFLGKINYQTPTKFLMSNVSF